MATRSSLQSLHRYRFLRYLAGRRCSRVQTINSQELPKPLNAKCTIFSLWTSISMYANYLQALDQTHLTQSPTRKHLLSFGKRCHEWTRARQHIPSVMPGNQQVPILAYCHREEDRIDIVLPRGRAINVIAKGGNNPGPLCILSRQVHQSTPRRACTLGGPVCSMLMLHIPIQPGVYSAVVALSPATSESPKRFHPPSLLSGTPHRTIWNP